MKINLTKKQSLEFFYNALCNGLMTLGDYGIELTYNDLEYEASRIKLTDACFEDVLIQMLRDGYKLSTIDHEGDDLYSVSIGINEVYERVKLVPVADLADMINENDDGYTADAILQTVFFKEIIFG